MYRPETINVELISKVAYLEGPTYICYRDQSVKQRDYTNRQESAPLQVSTCDFQFTADLWIVRYLLPRKSLTIITYVVGVLPPLIAVYNKNHSTQNILRFNRLITPIRFSIVGLRAGNASTYDEDGN
jgi:hypothetical protein